LKLSIFLIPQACDRPQASPVLALFAHGREYSKNRPTRNTSSLTVAFWTSASFIGDLEQTVPAGMLSQNTKGPFPILLSLLKVDEDAQKTILADRTFLSCIER